METWTKTGSLPLLFNVEPQPNGVIQNLDFMNIAVTGPSDSKEPREVK